MSQHESLIGKVQEVHLKRGENVCESCGYLYEQMRITNVLAAAHLGCTFNLSKVVFQFGSVQFDPSKMSCLIWRHKSIGTRNTTALLFASGYISVNGNTSAAHARKSIRNFARLLQKRGYAVSLSRITVQAISCVWKPQNKMTLDIPSLVREMKGQHEPELFSAAVVKHKGLSFLVFKNGTIIVTGMKHKCSSHLAAISTIRTIETKYMKS